MQINSKYVVIGVVIALIVIVIVAVVRKPKDDAAEAPADVPSEEPVEEPPIETPTEEPVETPSEEPIVEGYMVATGAHIDPVTGVIKGNDLITDGRAYSNPTELLESVAKDGSAKALPHGMDGLNFVDNSASFDKVFAKQRDALAIKPKDREYLTRSEQARIAKALGNDSNAHVNLFTRGTHKPLKMTIDPTGVMGVIDEKYLPDRGHDAVLRKVGTVIPIQGFDINMERMRNEFTGVHFSNVNPNSCTKKKRTPTATGAKVNTETDVSQVAIENDNGTVSMTTPDGENVMTMAANTGVAEIVGDAGSEAIAKAAEGFVFRNKIF